MDPGSVRALADADGGIALALVVTVLLAGFRHGFDIDHVAAITDIASASTGRKASLVLATCYAVGHMVVVFGLGVIAVFAGDGIPASWDALAGKLIGLSLIWLGVYVVYSIVRYRRDFRMRSRWMLLVAGARRGLGWIRPTTEVVVEHDHEHPVDGHHHHPHEHGPVALPADNEHRSVATRTTTHTHTHKHVVPMPSDPFTEYSRRTAFAIGVIHGVGAETPTQILLFTTAAGVSGAAGGVGLVALFVGGLLIGNTVVALVSVASASVGRRLPILRLGFGWLAAGASLIVGAIYLFS